MKKSYLLYTFVFLLAVAGSARAAATQEEFEAQLKGIFSRLDAEATGPDGVAALASLIQSQYSASPEELRQGLAGGASWGSIAVLAYIRATTGESFETLREAGADRNVWRHANKAGMNADKMARSLDKLAKQVEAERNTRIFDRLRTDRRISRLPDLGSGFGILQETLDFRHLESPRPTKVHTVTPNGR